MIAAVGLHVNGTYYTWHPAFKSVYEERQLVMGGKLFSFLDPKDV